MRRSAKSQRDGGWSEPLSHCTDRGIRGDRKKAAASEGAKIEGRGVTAMSVVAVTKEGARRHARARRNGHVGYDGYRKRARGGTRGRGVTVVLVTSVTGLEGPEVPTLGYHTLAR